MEVDVSCDILSEKQTPMIYWYWCAIICNNLKSCSSDTDNSDESIRMGCYQDFVLALEGDIYTLIYLGLIICPTTPSSALAYINDSTNNLLSSSSSQPHSVQTFWCCWTSLSWPPCPIHSKVPIYFLKVHDVHHYIGLHSTRITQKIPGDWRL